MRSLFRFALCANAALALSPILVSAAEAQQRRPLTVKVERRSFLDAGKVTAVGSMNRHLIAANLGMGAFSPVRNSIGSGGQDILPGYIGAGANPFANSIVWGTFR